MQWYESDPSLLEGEKMEMSKFFPNFTLDKLYDGRLYWMGELNPGIYETKFGVKKSYYVMVLYNNNYPLITMGSPIKIYPVLPDADEIIQECGGHLNGFLLDSEGNKHLCLNTWEETELVGVAIPTSSIVFLARAMKWVCGLEFVLTGDLSIGEFNRYISYGKQL